MRIMQNLASLNIFNDQNKSIKSQSKSLGRISSGLKLNSSADAPDGIARSEKLRMQIRGLQMASRNVQDGASMLQTFDGAMDSANSILQRIRELTVQAGGTASADDKTILQNEITQMKSGIDDIMNNAEFNGIKLLNGSVSDLNGNPLQLDMSISANAGETLKIPSFNLLSSKLGDTDNKKFLNSIDVTKDGGIDEALNIEDKSLEAITSARSKYGAIENRLESTGDMTASVSDSLNKADSSITDADICEEMMNYSRTGILIESGSALLAQTNKLPQQVLDILSRVK